MWNQVQDCGAWVHILDLPLTGDATLGRLHWAEPFCTSISLSKDWREGNSSYLTWLVV